MHATAVTFVKGDFRDNFQGLTLGMFSKGWVGTFWRLLKNIVNLSFQMFSFEWKMTGFVSLVSRDTR